MSHTRECDFDFIVVGSGFGGSVAAYRLAEKGYRVAAMEMGRRWTPERLPRTSWSIHRWFWRPKLALRGFFNMQFFRHVTILHGCAVGGGSDHLRMHFASGAGGTALAIGCPTRANLNLLASRREPNAGRRFVLPRN